jgi:ATP-dependent helicase HrpA
LTAGVQQVQEAYRALLDGLAAGMTVPQEWREIRWMIEELRVSCFAQPMRTAYPVSEKRIFKAIDELGGH